VGVASGWGLAYGCRRRAKGATKHNFNK